jgi:hypothetical protein
MEESYLSMGVLELGEPGWREAGWAEATEPQSEAGNDRGQAPQANEVREGVTRKLPKIEVKWNEVHQALEAWQEASTTMGGPVGPSTIGSLAQEWNKALKDDEFVAGVPNTRLKAWEEYFKWAQRDTPLSAEQQEILSWLRHGVKIEWVGADSKTQQEHPRYGQRRQQVLELLGNTLRGKGQRVRELSRARDLARCNLPTENLCSCMRHSSKPL